MFRRRYSTFEAPPTMGLAGPQSQSKFKYRAHTPPEIRINDKQPRKEVNAPVQMHFKYSAEVENQRRSHQNEEEDAAMYEVVSVERKSRSLSTSPINRKKQFNEVHALGNLLVVGGDAQQHSRSNDGIDGIRQSKHVNQKHQQSISHSLGNSLGGNLRQYRKLSYATGKPVQPLQTTKTTIKQQPYRDRDNLQSLVYNTPNSSAVRKTSLDSSLQAHSPVHNCLLLRRRSVYTYGCDSHLHPTFCARSNWDVSVINWDALSLIHLFL